MKIPFLSWPNTAPTAVAQTGGGPASDVPQPHIALVAGTEHKRGLHFYGDMEALPEYREVLTNTKQFAIQEHLHQYVAALCQGSAALLLATEQFRQTNEYLSLKQHLSRQYPSVKEGLTDEGVLLKLHSRATGTGVRDRREGQEALSRDLFVRIVVEAVRARATDIHVILRKEVNTAAILTRIDGKVVRSERIPYEHGLIAVGVAFTKMAEEDSRSEGTFNDKLEQSAMIPVSGIDGKDYKLRWQSIPISGGNLDVVLRVLQTTTSNAAPRTLEELGYAESHCRQMYAAARRTVGLTIVTGITGSGKSTTLMTLMTSVQHRHNKKLYSIEDPVEYKMYGVSQLSIQRSAKESDTSPMVAAIRAVLRADPDVVSIGEIRDREMALLAKTMVQSGHQVMTSLHAASAADVPGRLCSEEIGISRDTLGSRNFLSIAIYQRLLPLLCVGCRIPEKDATEEMFPVATRNLLREKFGLDPTKMFVRDPNGCEACNHEGTHRQTVIAEVMPPDLTILKYWGEGKDALAEEHWRSSRTAAFDEPDCVGKTALEHGLYKASQGLVDPIALEDAIEPFESYLIFPKKGETNNG